MPLSRIVALTLCFLASACNIRSADNTLPTPNEDNIIYVTATPRPVPAQSLPTHTATHTPTPAPTATPTVEPATLFAQGERLVLNGYLEDAAAVYRTLLNYGSAITSQERAQAAFRLGQVTLRAGFFQQAAAALTTLLSDFPESAQIAQAYFLRGDARIGLSQWEAAIADLQQYLLLRPGLIDSYVYERIADAQIALGQTEAALQNYERAINARRSKVPLLVLREKLAQIYITLERYSDAIAQYDAVLAVARNAPYRANITFSAAQVALAGGDLAAGVERLRAVFENYGGTATAWRALDLLSQQGVSYDGLQRGRAAFSAGDYQAAIDAFNEYTTTHELAAIPAELFLTLGRAYRQIGNSDAAAVAFQTIIDQYPQDPLFGDALLERGRTRFLAGDSPAAIQIYLAIADTYPLYEQTAGVALWRAAYLYGTNGQTARSREVFTRLADSYPDHEFTINGLFNAASAAVKDEEWTIAENLYARIASLSTGDDQAAAYMWMGRIGLLKGEEELAGQAFELAIAAAPDSYFAARSGDFRLGIQPFHPPAAWRFAFDEASELAAVDDWLREIFGIEDQGSLWRLDRRAQRRSAHDTRARIVCGRRI